MKLINFLGLLLFLQINLCGYSQGLDKYGRITAGMQTLNQTQRDLVASPTAGLLIWCSNCGANGELQVYNGISWINTIGGIASNAFTEPIISTNAANAISGTSAISGGTITSNGGSAVTASGVCWSTTTGPTLSDSFTTDGTTSGSFSSTMTGTFASQTTYYVRSYATNSVGTTYGNQVSFVYFPVGLAYQGGKVFYVFTSSDPGYIAGETHGLIAAVNLVSPSNTLGVKWSGSNVVTGATANAYGAGANNTVLILQNDSNAIAAKLSSDLSVTSDGVTYDDWYLPSKIELQKLYTVYKQINNGWPNHSYWSSTEENDINAAMIRFYDGAYFTGWKTSNEAHVTAIRKF